MLDDLNMKSILLKARFRPPGLLTPLSLLILHINQQAVSLHSHCRLYLVGTAFRWKIDADPYFGVRVSCKINPRCTVFIANKLEVREGEANVFWGGILHCILRLQKSSAHIYLDSGSL